MRLPPLNALRAFEAAARHGGYAGAADELFVTRGAISRHVKLLEEHLGVQLFRRLPQGIEPTEAGRRLLPVLTESFGRIAAEAALIGSDNGELRIVCPPTISIRWLMPGLTEFRALHPEIGIRLTTDFYGSAGFNTYEFDLGLSLENVPGRSPDIAVMPLLPMWLSPICAPRLLETEKPLRAPKDLVRFRLLHESADRGDWKCWLAAFGVREVDPMTGDVFHNLDMAMKAAAMGAGVVMGDMVLSRDELDSGALVMPFPEMKCQTHLGRYCLIGAPAKWNTPNVETFKQWVREKARKDVVEMGLAEGGG